MSSSKSKAVMKNSEEANTKSSGPASKFGNNNKIYPAGESNTKISSKLGTQTRKIDQFPDRETSLLKNLSVEVPAESTQPENEQESTQIGKTFRMRKGTENGNLEGSFVWTEQVRAEIRRDLHMRLSVHENISKFRLHPCSSMGWRTQTNQRHVACAHPVSSLLLIFSTTCFVFV